MNLRKILATTLTLFSILGSPCSARALDLQLNSSSKVIHVWPEGEVSFHTKLVTHWDWQAEPDNIWHGRITRVTYTLSEGEKVLHQYDSSGPTSAAIDQLPIEVVGYAALQGAELRFRVKVPGGLPELLDANEFNRGWLSRLGAPDTPIRAKVLKMLGPQFTAEALGGLVEEMLVHTAGDRAVPGFPNLKETSLPSGAGGSELRIEPNPEAPSHLRDLGAAKVQLELSGRGTETSTPAPGGVFPHRKTIQRTLQGSATVVEKRPDWEELAGSWPIRIELQTTIETGTSSK